MPSPRPCRRLALLLAGACLAAPARAAEQRVALTPQTTHIDMTSYAMGLFAQPSHFTRFAGVLTVDPRAPARCSLALTIDTASLTMQSAARQAIATGPDMLDSARYPTAQYRGNCTALAAAGALTLHGVTRPFGLSGRLQGATLVCEGSLHRGDFGMTSLPGLIGRTIRIRFTTTLPVDLLASLPSLVASTKGG